MRPKKVILCVDDNEQALGVRKYLLQIRGYHVLTALSGDLAMQILHRGTLIDLVVTDMVMPDMDGNELVRLIKQIRPDVPTLIISGYVKNFRANQADAFLPKGMSSPAELVERVRLMMARKRGPKKAAGVVAEAVTA